VDDLCAKGVVLIVRAISFQDLIPTYVILIHQRHRRTDRRQVCDCNTALCATVHREVKR